MKKSSFMPILVLACICLCSALLLSVINSFTAPIIADRENAAANAALAEVLPGGKNFVKFELDEKYPKTVLEGYTADGGYVFRCVGKGLKGDIVIMVGVDTEGKIAGTALISEGESKGYKEHIYNKVVGENSQYIGQNIDGFTPIIDAHASYTSRGFADAIKSALLAYDVKTKGAADTRTDEEVFADNLNIALGTEKKTFTRWFATEVLVDVKSVYVTNSADDGVVMLIGDRLVGVKAGSVTVSLGAYDKSGAATDATAEEKATAEAAYALYSATSWTEVTRPEGTKNNVLKISVTATGNYIIDMVTIGSYAADGEWAHGDGENIYFTVSITPAGRIIDVITTKSSESKNYGDACAKESFYASIRGAIREDILDLNFSTISPDDYEDQISAGTTGPAVLAGATFTTVYYQRALLDAFDVVTALLGSN